MGGTDDPSNLKKVTIEEHAEEHRMLWERYGNEYDRIAWLGLSSMIDKQEIISMLLSENGRRQAAKLTKEQRSKGGKKGGKISSMMHPERQSLGGRSLWAKPGMRQHLSEKRKEQSLHGKNPMQGKKQKRVCCLLCRNEFAFNNYSIHSKKCVS
jgi:hypothetical protein